jgi:hypothetical protein
MICRQGQIHLGLGFTAVVNKELSAKYETLVNNAPNLIEGLPWGKDFEVDVFKKPDFTALEVVSFATGGMLAHRRAVCIQLRMVIIKAFRPESM